MEIPMSIEKELQELKAEIAELKKSRHIRVKFQVNKTDSGIEIAGGPTTIEKSATLLGTVLVPAPNTPNTMMLGAVVVDDEGKVGTVGPMETLKIEL